jgi:outer membrane biosynthesis protein TonB
MTQDKRTQKSSLRLSRVAWQKKEKEKKRKEKKRKEKKRKEKKRKEKKRKRKRKRKEKKRKEKKKEKKKNREGRITIVVISRGLCCALRQCRIPEKAKEKTLVSMSSIQRMETHQSNLEEHI